MMKAGDWVTFDHRREHMVLGSKQWLAAAWQLKPVRNSVARRPRTVVEATKVAAEGVA